ncbi:MAG: YbdK family carboxylate-amine ligase [Solirubrobacterales bacterium]|nr:YbdK family carboxylate-amine ligase [Solirubrobacterales bacterium]
MTFTSDGVEETFAASKDFTVGLEEEFAIVDPATLDLVPKYEELWTAAQDDDVLKASIAGELISSEIEIRSGRGEDLHDAVVRQREARTRLFALAARHGVQLASTGTHPWADYREQPNIDTEHYRLVVEGLQYVARRNNTFSLHVHVGIQGINRAVRVCDRLRSVLPQLLAVSASSPFLDARNSGLHSARTQSFTRMFPRCGIPDVYGSWDEYRRYIDLLLATNSIVEYTQVWWSVRPHFAFGTVEVRICDAQTTAAESDALAALIVACVAQAARDEDEGRPMPMPPGRLLEENLWRAIRYGQDGRMIDLSTLREQPTTAAIEQLVNWTAPVRVELGMDDPQLPVLNSAQRQRAAFEAGDSMQAVYSQTVQETQQTYAQEAPAA